MSGLSGGITSSISGGNFWRGFGQGMIIEGFNHLRKQILAPTEKYIVEEGETLESIVRKKYPGLTQKDYEILVTDLKVMNNLNIDGPIMLVENAPIFIYQYDAVKWAAASSRVKYSKAWHDSARENYSYHDAIIQYYIREINKEEPKKGNLDSGISR